MANSNSDLRLPDESAGDLTHRPLTVPLLVRGAFDSGLFVVLCIIAGVCFVLGLFGFRERAPTMTVTLWGIAALVGLPCLVFGLWLRRRRQWLEVTLTGFVLSGKDRRRVYSDEQVVALAQNTNVSTEGKQHRGVILELASNEGTERIDCRYTVTPGQADPLASFLERLSAGLARRVQSSLADRGQLRGQNWYLNAQGLHIGRERVDPKEITWVGFYDRHLCVWRGEDERPFLRIPTESRNAQPLSQILWTHVANRPDHDKPPASLPLGRLLLERKAWGFLVGLAVLVAFLSVFALLVWLMQGDLRRRDRTRYVGFAVACLCGAGAGGLTCWRGWQGNLRFHERGIRQLRRGGYRELLYTEIGQVIWKRDQSLLFRPKAGLDRPTIRYRSMAPSIDLELAAMRDLACRPLAMNWAEKQPHGPLTWTPNLRFLPGGLEYRPTGLILTGEPMSVPYPFTSYRFEGEYFILLVGEKQEQECKAKMTHPNFFVGLLLLTWIYDGYKRQSLPDAGEHVPRAEPGTPGEIDVRFGARQDGGGGHVQG